VSVEQMHVVCPMCGANDCATVLRADEARLAERCLIPWHIVRCRSCRLVYVNPRQVGLSAQQTYGDGSYGFARSPLADAFAGGVPHSSRVLDPLDRMARTRGRLLDIGCATGDVLVAAQSRGWTASGVEVSPHAAAVARGRGFDVAVGTLRHAALEAERYDAVTLLDVIEHFDEPLAELAEVHRLLRPGGVLVVETPNWDSLYRRVLRRWWPALQARFHLIYFDARTLAAMLRRAGFEPVFSVTEIGAVLSAEGRARGLAPSTLRNAARHAVVRRRVTRPPGTLDRALLNLAAATAGPAPQASFSRAAAAMAPAPPAQPRRHAGRLSLAVNRPLDAFIVRRGMGEQLRVYARKV
jgi:SAM-dependent methyltransferase